VDLSRKKHSTINRISSSRTLGRPKNLTRVVSVSGAPVQTAGSSSVRVAVVGKSQSGFRPEAHSRLNRDASKYAN
jgi:hypothetical protein